MRHPEVPVIAPKPAPHDGLDGAKFGGHLGERLCALEDRPLRCLCAARYAARLVLFIPFIVSR